MEVNLLNHVGLSQSHVVSATAATRRCVVKDRNGRQIVMPRYTAGEAIEQIARAIVGRNASAEEKRRAWEHLRDQEGFTVEWVEAKAVRVPRRSSI